MPCRNASTLGGRASGTHCTRASPSPSSASSSPLTTSPATNSSGTRRRLLLVAAALVACIALVPEVLHITHVHAAADAVTCPYGWSLYEAPDAETSPTRQCMRIVVSNEVPASAAEEACAAIFASSGVPVMSADGTTPWPFARFVAPHGAALHSADENNFLQDLLLQATEQGLGDDAVLLLGGVAGYGLVEWYADTPAMNSVVAVAVPAASAVARAQRQMQAGNVEVFAKALPVMPVRERIALLAEKVAAEATTSDLTSPAASGTYTNFAADADWLLHAGTIVMRPNGEWGLLAVESTATTAYPFACAFEASAMVNLPDSTSSASGPTSQSSSSSSSSSSSAAAAAESSSSAAHPGNHRAHRPAVPQPAPACLDGWTPLPSSIDTSDGADNTVCYRLVANASEVGGRLGKTFSGAQAACSAAHPKATLASVMSRQENAWIVSALLSSFPSTSDCTCDGGDVRVRASSSTASGQSARTVYLGGSYMRDGTGAGLIGSWYADQYLFNASEYAATTPSSPSWPTAGNDYYANWGMNEPLLSYGVVGITPPAETCVCNNGTATAAAPSSSSSSSAKAGVWVGVDPRATQPFLCSYLNDGSAFPPTPPPTTTPPDSTTPPTPGPSSLCIPGWSYLSLTNSCYRVYPATTSTSTIASTAVTAATMEEECEQVLRGRVVPTKVGKARAVSMLTIAESNYVGALLLKYIDDPANHVSNSGSGNATPVSLAGISFIDSGEGGFYISGVRELNPELALSLWATAEPSSVKGCVAVDVSGLWHYVPCSTYTSPSMPENTAVRVEAYTCQYSAKDIDPVKDVIEEPTSTDAPEPTSGPGWSSDSDSSSSTNGWPPLGQRIASLSGATHVVVAAGSTGIYTLQGPNGTAPSTASVRGLHLYFAPLSAYYAYAAPRTTVDGTAIGNVFAGAQGPPTSMDDLLVLSPNASASRPFAPCEGYKDQSRITRVRKNTITVHHGNTSEVGYVCVSQDGKNYVPTALTFEVTETTVHGFIPAPPRTSSPAGPQERPTWLPPLFCHSSSPAASPSTSADCAVQQTLAIPEHSTGTVQLALRYSSGSGSNDGAVVTAQSPEVDTVVSHVRLSSRADCMGADVPFFLLEPEIALQQAASARYTRATSSSSPSTDAKVYSIFSYQYAAIRAARFSALTPLYNSSAAASQLALLQPPVEYFVCVAVQKTAVATNGSADMSQAGAASRRLLSLWNVSTRGSSSSSNTTNTSLPSPLWSSSSAMSLSSSSSSSMEAVDSHAFLLSIADRLTARTSLSPTGAAVRTYTAVPGLKAHIVPAPISVKGMWALPPRRLTQRTSSAAPADNTTSSGSAALATLVPTPATFNRSAHYLLRPTYAYSYGATAAAAQHSAPNASDAVPSVSHLHIPQYSSPILLLDGHDVQPGMLALLSQDPTRCNRLQRLPRNDPTMAAATWPEYLDTMVPLSTVSMRVESDTNSTSTSVATMAYMQLNLNHTGMWGHHPTRTDDLSAMEQTWYVCVAHSPLSPFVPLRAPSLKITVHRLHVERFAMDASAAFTSSDAVAAAEAADASTTHLNLNTGFAGMLWVHGVDVRLWATTTLHSAQVAFAVVMPSSGTPDETAAQCAHSNLFYSQQGLGLLTQDSHHGRTNMRIGAGAGGTEENEDVDTSVGMVIPLGFFKRQSTRRMQLCLSVPLPFTPISLLSSSSAQHAEDSAGAVVPQHRFFAPLVNTTLDVRPIQVLYMGRYSAIPTSAAAPSTTLAASTATSGTVVRLAEGARDVVLPLTGYGIRPDMTMFLSHQLCHGVATTASTSLDTPTDAARVVASQSLLNISVVSLYDLPSSYWDLSADDDKDAADDAGSGGRAHRPRVFVVLRHDDLLRKAAAENLFWKNTTIDPFTGVVRVTREPLNVCLYAPGTAALVFPTDFQLVVDPPRVTSIRNLPSDAALIARAAASLPAEALADTTSTAATVVYASSMDLVVEGFGLDDVNTWLMPAVDCSNASSFLWRAPVKLSALPSSHSTSVRIEKNTGAEMRPLYANASRYVDPQTSFSSWFATLQAQETVRFGANVSASSGQVIRRFQWCVRIVEADNGGSGASSQLDADTTGYVFTRIPYQLLIPTVNGFSLENARRGAPPSTVLALPTQDPSKGRWFTMQLVGPLVDVVHAIGNPLYLFLAPEAYSCHDVKNAYLNQGLYTFGNASFAAVNGSAVLLPRWLAAAGSYRLCASAIYPSLASAEEDVEAALQFFTLDGLRVQLVQAVYGVFALNHTTTVTVEQGQEWTLPISGSMLTNRSVVRFQTSAAKCGEPMVSLKGAVGGGGVLPDIPIQNDFTGFSLFGEDDESSEMEGGTSVVRNGFYIVLSQSLIRAMTAPASYVLCLQPQRSLAWRAAPSITLKVVKHVRRPTHYNYFPADGSEDVAALTALAPTKVALAWNTGEENMVNVVGAAGQQVSLALWCLPKPNASTTDSSSSSGSTSSSSSSDVIGVDEELVPCGDHRRIMFVKPLDNDDDPCFVDAEAVDEDVLRGPFVLDFGVLTLPHALSEVDGDGGSAMIIPNMTQPWIMCIETGPERWREPTYPMLQLQYTRAIPTSFRLGADDASNTTAPFPAHKADVEAKTSAEVDDATGMPIGGNTTLILYAQDSSKVVYLNGYGIERGHKLRFGSFCEEETTVPSTGSSGSGSSSNNSSSSSSVTNDSEDDVNQYLTRVSERQQLANPRLYTEALTIEDDNGVFLVPSTHLLQSEDAVSGVRGVPVCFSANGGETYKKTVLSLRVLPSQLQTDTEAKYRNLLAQILANTLLVPQRSRGSVDLSALMKVAKGVKDTSDTSSDTTIIASGASVGSYDDDDDSVTANASAPEVYVRVGTQVLFSASCSVNTHGLPLLTVTVPNVITLTKHHTAAVTAERLLLCFRNVDAAASAATAQASDMKENAENEVGAVTAAFQWYGLYYRVMGVLVDQVAWHAWSPTAAMKADNVNHVVLRRGADDDLLLPVQMASTVASVAPSSAASAEDELLQQIEQSPSTLSLLSLTRLYVGRPCFRSSSSPKPVAAISPYVASYAGVQLSFTANTVSVAPLSVDQNTASAGSLNGTLVAALPSSGNVSVPQFPLQARGSVCFSVDGGLQYLAVGIAHYTEDWAPTLRVTVDAEDNENNEDVAEVDDVDEGDDSSALRATTTAMRVYSQSSTTRRLMDTRFVDPRAAAAEGSSSSVLQVLADLGQLTTAMLWSGFVGADGFAMDGLLYMPASSQVAQAGSQQTPQHLQFSLDNRMQNVSTNLTLTVVPWSLTCYGATAQLDVFVRQQDVGLYASTAAGVCSAGVRDGARVRVVPLSSAACDDAALVDATYVMDLPTVQPGSWGAVSTPSSSSSSTASPFRAMQLPMALRYVPEGTYALCLRQDLPFVSNLPSEDATGSSSSSGGHGEAAAAAANEALYTAVYAPTPLRLHISSNWTILSVSGATMSADDGAATEESTETTSVSSVVALAQSSNAELAVTGTAVDVRGVPLLLALAPRTARTVARRAANGDPSAESWTWANGCAGVPDTWDPQTGASLLVHDTNATSGRLLSAPWHNAQDGVWRVDAAFLQEVEWEALPTSTASPALVHYTVCYSVDGGLTFHPAGVAQEALVATTSNDNTDSDSSIRSAARIPFTAVVVPPTITSLSASRAEAPGVETPSSQLGWSPAEATATSVRVQLLSTSATADAALTAIPHVTAYNRVDGDAALPYATRPKSYEYAWTGAFVGNGVGASSGRTLPASTTSAAEVPTVAAAVALVRTSLYGARCDGVTAASEAFKTFTASANAADWSNASAASLLAAPIFVMNLQHGGVWSAADTAAVDEWRRAQTSAARVDAFGTMNAALSHKAWVANTAAMWSGSASAPLNGSLLTGHATTDLLAAARSNGESILVCLSTDGAHFYSADVARAAFAGALPVEQQAVTVNAMTTSNAAAAQLSPWPLYVRARAAPTTKVTNATTTDDAIVTPPPLWMRETSMVMELLARPVDNTSASTATAPHLTVDAASLTRFQTALATQLGVDASVVTVQLARSGAVPLPASNTSTTTTTTTSTAAPVQGAPSAKSADTESVLRSAVAAVQARHSAQRFASTAEAPTPAAAAPQEVLLPTYALVVSIIADALAYNTTAQTSTLTASPDLLYRTVNALRGNVSGPALLSALVSSTDAERVQLYTLTVNFTMSNGDDLHTVATTTPNLLPASPPQEVAWQTLFMAIPYATLTADPVPDAEDNDTTSKVSWWVIPILLILPAIMGYGTYYVYKKYLKKAPEASPAAEVTVENIQ